MNNTTDNLGKFIFSRLRDNALRAENLKTIQEMTKTSYLGDHVSICRILGRFYCFIDTQDRTLGVQLMLKGFWEIQNTELIARLVGKDMTVIDVGANFGYFTLLMCGLVGNDRGKVYSIEANPKIFNMLSDSININAQTSKTTLLNCAIYKEKNEDLAFTFGNNSTMNGRLNSCKINPDKLNENEQLIKVKGNTLDNLIPVGEKIDFIKVDIEGAEEMFWFGSQRIRDENQQVKILMEFNARRYDDPAYFVDNIFSEGYQVTLVGKSEEFDKTLSAEALLKIPTQTHVMLLIEKT